MFPLSAPHGRVLWRRAEGDDRDSSIRDRLQNVSKTGAESYGLAQNRADSRSCFKLPFYQAKDKCACIVALLENSVTDNSSPVHPATKTAY